MVNYNPWPNGNIPLNLQRPELARLKDAGYQFGDAREVVDMFESKVAKFAGAKYGIAVDCCTHALELSLLYSLYKGWIDKEPVIIPQHTYISVPMMLMRLGFPVRLLDCKWGGMYQIGGTDVWDAAVLWKKGMYKGGLHCVSFQIKKKIPIGRGGMILTNDKEACEWFRLARYDGRDMSIPYDKEGHIKMHGYHYYMTPEDAARGILLIDQINDEGYGRWDNYPDLNEML